MTEDEYWQRLQAAGFRNRQRMSSTHFLMQTRSGLPARVEDPGPFSAAEREAICVKLIALHEDWSA